MANSSLQNHWQRHDWQRSPFAPDLRIVQALVAGKTASGAGFSRYDALTRCLGETAEIIALNKGESSEGLAAGPDYSFAATQALSERLERWALWGWWHGEHEAQPVTAGKMISDLRRNAGVMRPTDIWQLADFPHIQITIARSRSPDSAQPILGFGANICPLKSAQSALIELGLMELNLLAPRSDLHAYFQRLSDRPNALFPSAPPRVLLPAPPARSLQDRLTKANVNFTLHDRTPFGLDFVVVQAEIADAPSWVHILGPLLPADSQ